MILASAKVENLRAGENPATWKGNLEFLLARHKRTQRHHDALPYSEAPAFWRSLAADTSPNASLVRWTILTCTRYSEAANADWSEIDRDARTWIIPGHRMKGGKDHAIPLSHAAFAVLSESRTTSGLIFPSIRSGKKTSDVALAKVIRRHTVTPVTLHGWRSTFRDWSGDMTSHAREVAEGCLAHAVGSAVEQAYRRGSAIEKRRALLEAWSGFLKTGLSPLNQAVA
jgi:integrase